VDRCIRQALLLHHFPKYRRQGSYGTKLDFDCTDEILLSSFAFFFFGGVTVWDSLDWLGLGWRRVWQLNRAAKGERCWYVCLYVRVAYLHARIVYNERIERD
jgi:hypothetical protein